MNGGDIFNENGNAVLCRENNVLNVFDAFDVAATPNEKLSR